MYALFLNALQRWFSDVQIFPVVLEALIIGFLNHSEIRFRAYNTDSDELEISNDGRRVRNINGNDWIAAIGTEPFTKCRHIWRIDFGEFGKRSTHFFFDCSVGIAYPEPRGHDVHWFDITDFDNCYQRIDYKVKSRQDVHDYVTLEIDLTTASLYIAFNGLTKKIIKSDIPHLEQCTPYIALRYENDVVITS